MMNILEKIKHILSKTYNSDLEETEKDAVLTAINNLGDWESVKKGLFSILCDNDTTLWNEAITFIYYFQCSGYTFGEKETIPLLYNCLSISNDLDENLIWTITRTIKSLPYTSDYDPYNDDEMFEEIKRIDGLRNNIPS